MGNLSGIFSGIKLYAGNWQLVDSRAFTQEEMSCVTRAEVVDSQYGPACCFMLTTGQRAYMPLSTNSSLKVGDAVDLQSAKVITLYREGDGNITRLE
jgi:hypothetical protein